MAQRFQLRMAGFHLWSQCFMAVLFLFHFTVAVWGLITHGGQMLSLLFLFCLSFSTCRWSLNRVNLRVERSEVTGSGEGRLDSHHVLWSLLSICMMFGLLLLFESWRKTTVKPYLLSLPWQLVDFLLWKCGKVLQSPSSCGDVRIVGVVWKFTAEVWILILKVLTQQYNFLLPFPL